MPNKHINLNYYQTTYESSCRQTKDDALYQHHISEAQRTHRMIADVIEGHDQGDIIFALKFALWKCEEHDRGVVYLADERR